MKCAACGYEHDPSVNTAKERRMNDGHGGAYTVGGTPFRAFWPHGAVESGQPPMVFYACPKCGTVRAE